MRGMGYYTAVLFAHNWFAHRGTITISRQVQTCDIQAITDILLSEGKVGRRNIDTVVLLKNGKVSPEILQVWSRSNGHFITGEEKQMADMALQVENSMTQAERAEFLHNFCSHNPHYRGAKVADILSILNDTDSHLDKTDAMQEAHKSEIEKYPRGLYSMSVFVAIYCKMGTDWEVIHSLLKRFKK
jgi:hypothetical protein